MHENCRPRTHTHTHTHTHTLFNIGFTRQQWLHERASMLLHTYVTSFIVFLLDFLQKTGIMMSDRVNERAAKDDLIILCP